MEEIGSIYRDCAREHLAKAEELISAERDQYSRYACLELRLALEAICYGLLVQYRSELPRSGLRGWQPGKILKELEAIDDNISADQTLSIQDPQSGEWHDLGTTDRRFTAKWAIEAHNALGNSLHVPTIGQLASKKAPDSFRTRYYKYHPTIAKTLASQSWHLRIIGPSWSITCGCGFQIKRQIERSPLGAEVVCGQCGQMYTVATSDDRDFVLEIKKIVWECLQCGTKNAMPELQLVENILTQCRTCKEPTKVRRVWGIFQRGLSKPEAPQGDTMG